MRLAVYSSAKSIYSETFIKMQMERLPCVLRIHGEPLANETVPGGAIRRFHSLGRLVKTAWRCCWEGPKRRVWQAVELEHRLKAAGVDVMLVNYGFKGGILASVCRRLSIPLVVHFHGYDAHQKSTLEAHQAEYREVVRSASAVIAVSHGMKDALLGIGIPANKIHLIRYGVKEANFRRGPKGGAPLFFGVGRFVDKKAPYLTVLAFAKARERLPGATLVLAGDGPLLETTRNVVSALGLSDVVELPGVISHAEVGDYMTRATAFVQHSLEPAVGPSAGDREGTPVAVLEAMMAGLPVIATRHAGIGEVIKHQVSGLLIEERDVKSMAEAMVAVGCDSAFAERLGFSAKQQAMEYYRADQYIERLKSVCADVIQLRWKSYNQ